jgi:hypothetical protein
MINVIKATGEIEPFSEEKLRLSIRRAGISTEDEDKLVEYIKTNLYENIHTSQIYKQIRDYFKQNKSYGHSKYSLKQALMDLGPTGYPFEDFVSSVLQSQGYSTQVRQIISGKCINHEIDVVAEKGNEKIMVEAKFHNAPGIKTDVHVAMYTKARFDDVKEKNGYSQAWIATNTKVTEDALSFALCCNMKVLGWSYPENESLRGLIERSRLFPITTISTLSHVQKLELMQNHIVMCKDIINNPSSLAILGLQGIKRDRVLEEANYILNHS